MASTGPSSSIKIGEGFKSSLSSFPISPARHTIRHQHINWGLHGNYQQSPKPKTVSLNQFCLPADKKNNQALVVVERIDAGSHL